MLESQNQGSVGRSPDLPISCLNLCSRGGPLIVIFASGLDNGTEAKSFQDEF